MSTAADPTANSHIPLTPGGGGGGDVDGGVNNLQPRRPNLQSPWAQVVRGVESESATVSVAAPRSPSSSPPIAAAAVLAPEQSPALEAENSSAPGSQADNSDDGHNGNAARSKKPAWSIPANGVVIEGTSVMGDSVSWPALSESTRSTGKSSSDSSKSLADGSASTSQGHLISQTPAKQQANSNANTNSAVNHGNITRPRPVRHRAGPPAQGGNFNRVSPPTPPPMPPPFPAIFEMPRYGNFGNFVPPPVLDSPARGARPMSGVGSNDHSTTAQRNNSRRNNFGGGRPLVDQNPHGGRRDHDRRDLPHQFVPPPPPPPGGYIPAPPPPPPGSAPFIPAPSMRPYVGPMGYDMPPPPYMYVPTLPYITAPPSQPVFFPFVDHPLPAMIVRQIDYYFSDANLAKDAYLRSKMDEEGWVPINLIASFPRVQQLTIDIPLILESLKASVVVEVKEQDDKIRRRNDWRKWIHTSGSHISAESGLSQTPGTSSNDILTNSMNKISLNEVTSGKGSVLDSPKSGTESARKGPTPDDSDAASSIVANGDVAPDEELHAD